MPEIPNEAGAYVPIDVRAFKLAAMRMAPDPRADDLLDAVMEVEHLRGRVALLENLGGYLLAGWRDETDPQQWRCCTEATTGQPHAACCPVGTWLGALTAPPSVGDGRG